MLRIIVLSGGSHRLNNFPPSKTLGDSQGKLVARQYVIWGSCTICKWPAGFHSLLEILKVMVMKLNSSSYNKQIAMQKDVMQQSVVNWKCTVSMGTDDQRVLDIAVRMLCDSVEAKDLF